MLPDLQPSCRFPSCHCQLHEDAIESAKSAANTLKRRANLGALTSWHQVQLKTSHGFFALPSLLLWF
jgi:hypothetical protein